MWKKDGSITIYLSLVFTIVLALICTIIESARMYAAEAKVKGVTYVAAESALGGYVREIFDKYGLMMYWDENNLENDLSQYINSNLEISELTGLDNVDLYGIHMENIETSNTVNPLDDNGEELMNQIVEYMKYKSVGEGIDLLLEQFDIYQGVDNDESPSAEVESMDDYDTKLLDIAEELAQRLDDLKELGEKGEKLTEKAIDAGFGTEKFIGRYNKVIDNVDKLYDLCPEISAICNNYESERENLCAASEGVAKELLNDNTVASINEKISKIQDLIEELHDSDGSYEEKIELIENLYNKISDVGTISASSQGNGINPKELLQYVKDVVNNGILGVIVEDVNNVSDAVIDTEGLPSNEKSLTNTNNTSRSLGVTALRDKALYTYYLSSHFGNYTNVLQSTALSYELEYVLSGANSDRTNLTKAVEKILGVREIFNMEYLLSDSVKRNEAYEMALAFTGAIGLPALAIVAQGIILAAWALAEAIVDVKSLLAGEKVPLIKSSDTWSLSLSNVASVGEYTGGSNDKKTSGFTYENYLQMLLLAQSSDTSLYRMADLIQVNMQNSFNAGFAISDCVLGFKINAEYNVEGLFLTIPLVKNVLGLSSEGYKIDDSVEVEY